MATNNHPEPPVRIIGSRELHQNLPQIMRELENNDARYVLTVRGKPKAILVGASTYLSLVQDQQHPSERLVGLQLSALLGISPADPAHEPGEGQTGPTPNSSLE